MLTRTQIETRIPHAGTMCLLDTVTSWDATSIVCQAAAPTPDHPLAEANGVPTVAAVEYAAQATAVHGALLDNADMPRDGVLAKISDLELTGTWLEESSGPLTIRAELLSRADCGCLYAFTVHDADVRRARGRLLVAYLRGD